MSRILDVYLHNDLVGQLTQKTSGDLTFRYDESYRNHAQYGISLSLPLDGSETLTGDNVKAFFSGLLPEESVRKRLAEYLGVSENNSFSLLEIIGGDCAGALAFYPCGEKPEPSYDDIEILDDNHLKEILNLIKTRPMLAGDDGYRLSLAGAQDKLAVGFVDGKIHLIKGGQPTTHILKPLIEHVEDSAHNELFCMQLAKRMGIDAPQATLHFVEDIPYYLVERYDRTLDKNGNIIRIHQEDFCQALGIAPEIKYQREGGVSIAMCQDIIKNHTKQPAVDQRKLMDIIIFNYLIGNADAHGKNFSILYKDNKPELSPAYDLLSTAVYPQLSEKMAMKIGGQYKPRFVFPSHFYKHVPDTKAAHSVLDKQIKSMTDTIYDKAIDLKSKLEKDGLKSPIFDEIIAVIQQRTKQLR